MLQLIKFLGVGAIATIIQYLLLILFVEFDVLNPVAASAASYSISAVFNYLANYYITFDSDVKHHVAAMKFTVVAVFGLALNTLCMYILFSMLGLYYILAQLITTGIVLAWNFFAHKYWTYVSN